MKYTPKGLKGLLSYRKALVITANACGLVLEDVIDYHSELEKVEWDSLPKAEAMREIMRVASHREAKVMNNRMTEAALIRSNINRGLFKQPVLVPVEEALEKLEELRLAGEAIVGASHSSPLVVERRQKVLDNKHRFPEKVPLAWLQSFLHDAPVRV